MNLCAERQDGAHGHEEDQGLRANQSWQEESPPPSDGQGRAPRHTLQIHPDLAPAGRRSPPPHGPRPGLGDTGSADGRPARHPPQLPTEDGSTSAGDTRRSPGTVSLSGCPQGAGSGHRIRGPKPAVSSPTLGLPSLQSTQRHLCEDTGFKTHTVHTYACLPRHTPHTRAHRAPLHTLHVQEVPECPGPHEVLRPNKASPCSERGEGGGEGPRLEGV